MTAVLCIFSILLFTVVAEAKVVREFDMPKEQIVKAPFASVVINNPGKTLEEIKQNDSAIIRVHENSADIKDITLTSPMGKNVTEELAIDVHKDSKTKKNPRIKMYIVKFTEIGKYTFTVTNVNDQTSTYYFELSE